MSTRRGSAERADDFAVSSLRKRLQRLCAHEAEAPELQDVTCHDGVVGRLADSDKVELAHHHVKLLHLAAHVGKQLLGGVEPSRRVLRGLDASVGQVEERYVGGHCFLSYDRAGVLLKRPGWPWPGGLYAAWPRRSAR